MTELTFKGKEFVYNHHLSVPFRSLVIHPEKGIGDPALDGNLIVHGDNLHALKALLPLYAGKVDCIFIDPPYNTGNEGWCYNDNVNAPMIKEWLDANPVGIEDGLRHDKWCAMMWPRLRLLHELLAEDGIFLMHIDENELDHATSMIDEIFGHDPHQPEKKNLLGNIVWDKKNPKGDARGISYQHEFIIVAAKRRSATLAKRILRRRKPNVDAMLKAGRNCVAKIGEQRLPLDLKKIVKKYKINLDPTGFKFLYDIDLAATEFGEWVAAQQNLTHGEKAYKWLDADGEIYRLVHMGWPNKKRAPEEYFRPIPHPVTGKDCPVPARGWRYPPETIETLLGDDPPIAEPLGHVRKGQLVFGADETRQPQRKYLLCDFQNENVPSIIGFGGSDDSFFHDIGIAFENPKPHQFICELVKWMTCKDDVVLDSFAGSGTLGHAVLLANEEDGGQRRFILVQMDEGEGSVNADTHTAERMRRVIRGLPDKTIENTAIGGSFAFCSLSEPIELDKLLTGDTRPPYEALGSVLFHMATNLPLNPDDVRSQDFYLGEAGGRHVWLIYKPDLDWLKSPEAALTLDRARALAKRAPKHRHLVIAPARYVSQKMLTEENIPVEYAPLPDALFGVNSR